MRRSSAMDGGSIPPISTQCRQRLPLAVASRCRTLCILALAEEFHAEPCDHFPHFREVSLCLPRERNRGMAEHSASLLKEA